MNSHTQSSKPADVRPHVVIIGGGFAGLNAARAFKGKDVCVTLLDRKNHHTFQPLLYQVALAALSPAEVASPIRTAVRGQKNVEVLIGTAEGFELDRRVIRLKEGIEVSYDYLIVATGATHSYFGHPEWAKIAPGLKSLEDATEIRRRILLAFGRYPAPDKFCGGWSRSYRRGTFRRNCRDIAARAEDRFSRHRSAPRPRDPARGRPARTGKL